MNHTRLSDGQSYFVNAYTYNFIISRKKCYMHPSKDVNRVISTRHLALKHNNSRFLVILDNKAPFLGAIPDRRDFGENLKRVF